jgi:hypothetical protein
MKLFLLIPSVHQVGGSEDRTTDLKSENRVFVHNFFYWVIVSSSMVGGESKASIETTIATFFSKSHRGFMSLAEAEWSELHPIKRGIGKFIESTIYSALGGVHYRNKLSQYLYPIKDPVLQALSARYFSALSVINTVDESLDKWNFSLSRSANRISASARTGVDYFGDDAPVETTVLSQFLAGVPALLTATIEADLIPYATNLLEELKTDLLALDGLRKDATQLQSKLENGKGDAAEAGAARVAFEERLDAYLLAFEEKRRALARKVWDSKNSIMETLCPDGDSPQEPVPVQANFDTLDAILREAKPVESPRPSLDTEEDPLIVEQPS